MKLFFIDALNDIYVHLLIDCEGGKAPQSKLYDDLAGGKFKYAGQLLASSITLNGPAPNIFTPWVYNYIVGGLEKALGDIPSKLGEGLALANEFEKVIYIYNIYNKILL